MRLLRSLLLAFLAAPAGAASRSPALVVEAPPELAGIAAQVRGLGEEGFAEILELTGAVDPGAPIHVILAAEGGAVSRNAPSWVAGYALPELGAIVLFPARVPSYPDRNLAALVAHEVAHVMVARAAGQGALPRWFAEGLATVAAREWALEDRARFALAVVGRAPRSLAELDAAFTGDDAAVTRAYALSSALVRSLLQRYGSQAAALILGEVAAGSTFAVGFAKVTGETPKESAARFFGREAFWNTWVPFLTSSTALWMGITLLSLWAIRKRRERDAAIRERFALEEELQATRRRQPPAVDESGSDRLKIN
ncbi:MAG: hypothetical protein V1750_10610 [Acidobacteriota bacterium]